MEKYGYINTVTHINLHENLKKAVRDINSRLIFLDPADELLQKKISNIFNLLLDHIKNEDKRAASFIKYKRAGQLAIAA